MNTYSITSYERPHRQAVADLLFYSAYTHHHLDWHDPETWLATDDALTCLIWQEEQLIGLIASHAPLGGASWIRVAAVEPLPNHADILHLAWTTLRDQLRALGGQRVCWLVTERWLDSHLPVLGFSYDNEIITLRRTGVNLPERSRPVGLTLRSAESDDVPLLVAIDHAAFVPPWQNVPEDVRLARRQAALSTVAMLHGEAVGYQITTLNQNSGHLARLATLPAYQGHGIGSALVSDMIAHLLRRRIRTITVNTQQDNLQSLKLYHAYHFERSGFDMPVWVYPL